MPPARLPIGGAGAPQSDAEVQLRGNRIMVATRPAPCTAHLSSGPQSPWLIQGVSGSAAVTRRKKSWSLWNCDGWRAGAAKSAAGEKTAPLPIAVFQIELELKGSRNRSRHAAAAGTACTTCIGEDAAAALVSSVLALHVVGVRANSVSPPEDDTTARQDCLLVVTTVPVAKRTLSSRLASVPSGHVAFSMK